MNKFVIFVIFVISKVIAEENVGVRVYTVNSNINVFMNYIPHMAIEVKSCNDIKEMCFINSYGKAKNGKIYSPDLLTEGRDCGEFLKWRNCKPIPTGYNFKNITEWISVPKSLVNSFLEKSFSQPKSYNIINNNCITFVSEFMQHLNIDFNF